VALERLGELGAISLDPLGGPLRATTSASGSRYAVPAPPPLSRPAVEVANGAGRVLHAGAELEEVVEIDADRRSRIDELFARLEDLNYYEVLGVGEQDDKKKIKAAYYALAPEFHPDRFFRKQIGPYKAKIEAIFARFTLAHDVLTTRQRREEYDEYLEQIHRNRSMFRPARPDAAEHRQGGLGGRCLGRGRGRYPGRGAGPLRRNTHAGGRSKRRLGLGATHPLLRSGRGRRRRQAEARGPGPQARGWEAALLVADLPCGDPRPQHGPAGRRRAQGALRLGPGRGTGATRSAGTSPPARPRSKPRTTRPPPTPTGSPPPSPRTTRSSAPGPRR